jgi:hypothetical protein
MGRLEIIYDGKKLSNIRIISSTVRESVAYRDLAEELNKYLRDNPDKRKVSLTFAGVIKGTKRGRVVPYHGLDFVVELE